MKAIATININNVAFFDIETVGAHENMPSGKERELFLKRYPITEDTTENEHWRKYAPLSSIFGKIVSIVVRFKKQTYCFTNESEKELLQDFVNLFGVVEKPMYWCGHYIKKFDVPFLTQRLLIYEIPLYNKFDILGSKPWEQGHLLDTHEIWTLGVFGGKGTLDELCFALRVPSPKEKLDGSQVHDAFYENKLASIEEYCEKDVLAVAQVFYRLQGN